jgi:hypothetical protein
VYALASAAFLAMLATMLATGARLLATAWRTRRDPELWLGLALLVSSLGGALDTASTDLFERGRLESAFQVQAASRVLYAVGTSALALGVTRIFRPDRAFAQALALALGLVVAGLAGAWIERGHHARAAAPSSLDLALLFARLGPLAWSSAESFTCAIRLRRRARLGLADPSIARQILLWGVAGTAMGGALVVIAVTLHGLGRLPLRWTPSLVAMTALGWTGAVTLWVAFFPPRAWRERTAARSVAP